MAIVSLLRGSNVREAFLTDRWICLIVSLLRGSNDREAFLSDRWVCLIVSFLRKSYDRIRKGATYIYAIRLSY